MPLPLKQLLLFTVSFLVVALAQPDWSVFACILASSLGYALFWKGLLLVKRRFLIATLWFAGIQAVQMSWFATDRYVGAFIYPVLAVLFLALGAQFGLISLFVRPKMSIYRILGISGGWALMEWARLFFLSGYVWNPSGLALSGTLYSMQLASAIGVFGMGFWIFFTNLLLLRGALPLWGMVAVTPYLFGWAHVMFHEKQMKSDSGSIRALAVQTALYPEEKMPFNGSTPLRPDEQWERALYMLAPKLDQKADLILFSEAAIPYAADAKIYPIETLRYFFAHLPPTNEEYVDNLYWAHALADNTGADVVIGLEDYQKDGPAYNAAFLVRPGVETAQRYEKRVLVPMGEYIPFAWCRKFLARYGIRDSFTAGTMAKVFETSTVPIGLSICYEEGYGHLMRQSRCKGAELLLNLTNDVWYPRSRLPMVHFMHGRLRSVESGIPLLRSCNTGVTCGVNALGQIMGMLDYESAAGLSAAGVLALDLPTYTYSTFYTRFGDLPTLILSALAFFFLCIPRRIDEKQSDAVASTPPFFSDKPHEIPPSADS